MKISILRSTRPRLYHAVGDPAFEFRMPADAVRQRILANIVGDCVKYERRTLPRVIPEKLDSPHPFHQLYITFYSAMEATAMIEHYSFAWRMTGDTRWLKQARKWLLKAVRWEHSDRIEEHFYTANRYMQAFAVALDWLEGALTAAETAMVTEALVLIMRRWWPEVREGRHQTSVGHHVVVDNGHFGVAALQLLGHHDKAGEWVGAIVDRFCASVMPHGCGSDGAPIDGPGFWAPENMWMLHFADALRNVTGIDLYREFPQRTVLPARWLKPFLTVPAVVPDELYARPNTTILNDGGYSQLDHAAPVLLRLAQEAGDAELRELALRDPRLGRVQRYGSGVKGTPAECMLAWGPYAYLFYDPHFKAAAKSGRRALSLKSDSLSDRTVALLRSDATPHATVAAVWEFIGAAAHGLGRLHLQWAGYPVLKTICCAATQPLGAGTVPFIGEQHEVQFTVGKLETGHRADRLEVESPRLQHEYWLLHGKTPALLVAVRRKPRGYELRHDDGAFVRLDGTDSLWYDRRYFNPDEGELRIRTRLHAPLRDGAPGILFATGVGVPGTSRSGFGVNVFSLGFVRPDELSFRVKSNRMHEVAATLPGDADEWLDGRWRDVVIKWGGFNQPTKSATDSSPFIELRCDDAVCRVDDPALFGELGRDVQGLARSTPRPFRIQPKTHLSFGAAMQISQTGASVDFAEVELNCPGRRKLSLDVAHGLGPELGGSEFGWTLNPVRLCDLETSHALLDAGDRQVRVGGIEPFGAAFSRRQVPFAPGGFAASSLKSYIPSATDEATQVVARARHPEAMVLLFTESDSKVSTSLSGDALDLTVDGSLFHFHVGRAGEILSLTGDK